MHRWKIHLLLAGLLAFVALPARAYLDLASGSMILQLLLGGLAGVAVVIKLYCHKLLGLFGVKREEHDDPPA